MKSNKKSNNKKLMILLVIALSVIGLAFYLLQKPAVNRPPDSKELQQDESSKQMPYANEISVDSPKDGGKVSSPLTITGKAKGSWYFEGIIHAELFDSEDNSLGTVTLNAKGDWMSEDLVPFEGSLDFVSPGSGNGKLIIKNDNPSGMPENDRSIVVPVTF